MSCRVNLPVASVPHLVQDRQGAGRMALEREFTMFVQFTIKMGKGLLILDVYPEQLLVKVDNGKPIASYVWNNTAMGVANELIVLLQNTKTDFGSMTPDEVRDSLAEMFHALRNFRHC